jgi:hypothetical protein
MFDAMNWSIVAGSATGLHHVEAGLPCQDAFAHSRSGRWFIAVVCDGAGSARHSDIGARHAAETIIQELSLISDMAPGGLCDARFFWHKAIIASIGSARMQLKKQMPEQGDLSDFHATVVGAVAGPDYGLFFHVGDGAGFAVERGRWESVAVSGPENGDFADQTFFYTMDNWRDHLRLTFFDPAAEVITLMSDGAMAFVANKQQSGLDPKFIVPVIRYLDTVDEQTGSKALTHTLDSPQTHAITGDDKTLLIALKRS